MRNVSLLKLSAIVVVAAMASSAVSANEDAAIKVEKVTTVKAQDVVQHDVLFKPLDADNNGLITQAELGDSDNALLKKEFSKIDVNSDQGISELELKNYLEKIDVKVNI